MIAFDISLKYLWDLQHTSQDWSLIPTPRSVILEYAMKVSVHKIWNLLRIVKQLYQSRDLISLFKAYGVPYWDKKVEITSDNCRQ